MTTIRPSERSLLFVIVSRIALFASLAMGVQIGVVFMEYYLDDAGLARLMLDAETTRLSEGLTLNGDRLGFSLPPSMSRYNVSGSGYLTRVRTSTGAVLFSNCDAQCSPRLLPTAINPPDFWLQQTQREKPISLVGGRSFEIGSNRILIEIGILGDPYGVVWLVIGHEIVDDMAVPMILMLVFVVGATILSTRRALRPIENAAAQAAVLDPLDPTTRLSTEKMPREFAHLARAFNLAITRIGELIRSQRVFTAAVAHEIRTPLAVMKLELGHIADQRARQVERDLDQLAYFVEQVTSLARLETAGNPLSEAIDPTKVGRAVVAALAPWVYTQKHSIAFIEKGGRLFLGEPTLVESALRNLVENAVRHTRGGTAITVESGPGEMLSVVDDAGKYMVNSDDSVELQGTTKRAGGIGIGLEIVRRIAAIHGASFEMTIEPGQYTRASISFEANGPSHDPAPAISPSHEKGLYRDA